MPERSAASGQAAPALVALLRIAGVIVIILAALAAAGWVMTAWGAPGRIGLNEVLVAAFMLGLAGGVGLALWAMAWMVEHQGLLSRPSKTAAQPPQPLPTQDDVPVANPAEPTEPSPVPVPPDQHPTAPLANLFAGTPDQQALSPDDSMVADAADPKLSELLAKLNELNDNLMLTPQQRQTKRQRQTASQIEKLVAGTQQSISFGDFPEAQRQLDALGELAPEESRIDELTEQLQAARDAAEKADLEHAQRQVEDFMALGRFAEARDQARQLLQGHPDCQEARDLLARVERESQAFTTERRRRMYREIERAVNHKQWRQALVAASEFLQAFPESTESQLVEAQLETLEDNARIQTVRDHRDEIRDLIERHRYAEAVDLASRVVQHYPETQAAGELQQQLPRLRELAANQKATRL